MAERRGRRHVCEQTPLRFETAPPIPAFLPEKKSGTETFSDGVTGADLLPREKWARVISVGCARRDALRSGISDVCGEAILRRAIVDYLRVSRSIECLPEQVFATRYADSYAPILRTLVRAGSISMWVEDPGFPLIRPVITQEGITLADSGRCRWLNKYGGDAGLPAGTLLRIGDARPPKPAGVALPLTRRRQLLAWAANAGLDY